LLLQLLRHDALHLRRPRSLSSVLSGLAGDRGGFFTGASGGTQPLSVRLVRPAFFSHFAPSILSEPIASKAGAGYYPASFRLASN
jgi:hypothetical protein